MEKPLSVAGEAIPRTLWGGVGSAGMEAQKEKSASLVSAQPWTKKTGFCLQSRGIKLWRRTVGLVLPLAPKRKPFSIVINVSSLGQAVTYYTIVTKGHLENL